MKSASSTGSVAPMFQTRNGASEVAGSGSAGFQSGSGAGDQVGGADHALDDVVDIGEVAAVAAVVEDLDRAALEDGVGEFHRRHVGPAPGAVDREEAQAGAGQAVEMGVGMRHQLVGALGGGVELERMVDALALLEGHGGVGAVDARGRGVGEMRRLRPAAGLEDVGEAHEVALDVGARVLDGMAHAGLGGEVDHPVEGAPAKAAVTASMSARSARMKLQSAPVSAAIRSSSASRASLRATS